MFKEHQVEAAAKVIAASPMIEQPKLPPASWMGLARAALEAALIAPQPRIPSPYRVGESYTTQAGAVVRFVGVKNEGTIYETMYDEDGVHRYTTRDFGRVTGTAHDYSDPRNVPPPETSEAYG